MQEACQIHAKNDRYARVGEISGEATEALSESLSEEFGAETAGWIKKAMYELETTVIRRLPPRRRQTIRWPVRQKICVT